MSYTVHGDTVNLAARLQALNKRFGTRILVADATHRLAGDAASFRDLGECEVRGHGAAVRVWAAAPAASGESGTARTQNA